MSTGRGKGGKGLGKGGMFHRTSGRDGTFKGNFTSTAHLNRLTDNGHPTIWCDQCSSVNTSTNRPTTFIQGVRYRCSMCPNFDLCSRCIEPNVKQHPSNHLFLRIDVQQRDLIAMFPAAVNRSTIIHPNSTCIGCNKSGKDFQGIRYQCAQCQIDLCEACEMQGIHDTSHMRLKFSTPSLPSSPQPPPPCTCSGTFGRPCVACRTRIGPGNVAVSTLMARTESGRSDGYSSASWNRNTYMGVTGCFGMAHQTSGRDGTFGGNNSSGSNNTTFGSGTK